jgi:hypothetical protein
MGSIQTTFKFSPRLLDHLGISAYNSVRKCLAELVANSYDADAEKVSIQLPDIIDENALIEIEDNGTGMSPQEIENNFLLIGRNRRKNGERTDKKRLVIGSKGIGKLAGFGIASRMNIIAYKDGVQSQVSIDRADFEDVATLNQHQLVITTSETGHSNGTKLQLIGLHPDLQLIDPVMLRRHLYRVMPKVADFIINVNEIECTPDDILGFRSEFTEVIENVGTVNGFYIIANSRQSTPGMAVRVRGRIVQEPSLFGLDTRSHGFFTAEKVIGEINADFLDPETAENETLDLIKTTRDGFLEDSPKVNLFTNWAADFVKRVIKGIDESESKKRTDLLMNQPEVRERLEKLPPHIKATATKVVRGVISKLTTASDADARDLIEWILRYYESNVLKELMRAILSADIKEAEKLSDLIQEWGLTQVNSVVGIIRTQIEIIQKLEELVVSEKAKEIELHKLIENNLWLVREGLELWSSDKPLKTILETRLDELYEGQNDLRPDLVCRSRNDGKEAVILEFKRPKETIKMTHVTQAMEYAGLLKKHRPSINFETFVVGREYHPDVLATKEKLEKASLFLWSYEEILQRSRMRFEQILEILGQE